MSGVVVIIGAGYSAIYGGFFGAAALLCSFLEVPVVQHILSWLINNGFMVSSGIWVLSITLQLGAEKAHLTGGKELLYQPTGMAIAITTVLVSGFASAFTVYHGAHALHFLAGKVLRAAVREALKSQ